MMIRNRRTWSILLALLAVAVLVVVIVFLVKIFGDGINENDGDVSNTEDGLTSKPLSSQGNNSGYDGGGVSAIVTKQKDPEKQVAESMARLFIERIGSFSTQSNFQNLNDLKGMMTERAQKWAEDLKKSNTEWASLSKTYYGVTTKVLTVKILEWNPGSSAVIEMSAQRQEKEDGVEDSVYYQTVEVDLVHRSGSWLIDQVEWGDRR